MLANILIRQKLMENAKVQYVKGDILSNFQTMCKSFFITSVTKCITNVFGLKNYLHYCFLSYSCTLIDCIHDNKEDLQRCD